MLLSSANQKRRHPFAVKEKRRDRKANSINYLVSRGTNGSRNPDSKSENETPRIRIYFAAFRILDSRTRSGRISPES